MVKVPRPGRCRSWFTDSGFPRTYPRSCQEREKGGMERCVGVWMGVCG